MRMDQESYISTYDLINYQKRRLLRYCAIGEERWHNRIARHLVGQRLRRPIASTTDLVRLCCGLFHCTLKGKGFIRNRTFRHFALPSIVNWNHGNRVRKSVRYLKLVVVCV